MLAIRKIGAWTLLLAMMLVIMSPARANGFTPKVMYTFAVQQELIQQPKVVAKPVVETYGQSINEYARPVRYASR